MAPSAADRLLAGSRIRSRRLDAGLRQADLAQMVGISPSYLNLIEHNRRRIAGRLLNDIARILEVDPASLSEGAEDALLDQLRAAAVLGGSASRPEDFAGRFPDWARLVVDQSRRIAALEAQVNALGDRLAHDPELSASLHQVIDAATAIRSTAAILASGERIDSDWQARFQRNIHSESLRLAESSRALAQYLQAPEEDASGAPLSPQAEVEQYLEKSGYYFADLEGAEPAATPAELAAEATGVGRAGRKILEPWLEGYRSDAAALPIDRISRAWAETGDPLAVAGALGVDLARVLRRLATLPPELGPARAGLATCDASGAILQRRAVEGVVLPRGGAACPLWPLFEALGSPGRPITAVAQLPGDRAPRLLCYAVAAPRAPTDWNAMPLTEAVMLLLPDAPENSHGPDRAVGPGCRLCPRDACPARREPSILST